MNPNPNYPRKFYPITQTWSHRPKSNTNEKNFEPDPPLSFSRIEISLWYIWIMNQKECLNFFITVEFEFNPGTLTWSLIVQKRSSRPKEAQGCSTYIESIEGIVKHEKHEYLGSRASRCLSLSSSGSHLTFQNVCYKRHAISVGSGPDKPENPKFWTETR